MGRRREPNRGDAATPKRRRSLVARLTLLAVSLIVILLVLELLVRLFWSHEYDTSALRQKLAQSAIGSFTRPSADSSLVYELRPGLIMSWKGVRLRTSGDGRRIGADDADEIDGAARLALIGDSTAFGWGVGFEDCYGSRVASRLSASLGRDVGLGNFAVPGYNTGQQLAAYEHKVAPWQPSLLIAHYDHNDAQTIGLLPPGAMPPTYGDNALGSALVKIASRRLRSWRSSGERGHGDHGDHARHAAQYHDSYPYSGDYYDDHIDALRELGRLAAGRGLPVVVVIFDSAIRYKPDLKDDAHYQKLHAGLVPFLKEHGFYVLDLYHAYREHHERHGPEGLSAMRLSEHDHHPNALGHQFIAHRVAAFIESNSALMRRLREHHPTAAGPHDPRGRIARIPSD